MAHLYCVQGLACSIYTSDSNIGNYTGDLRIVISGEDIAGSIVLLIGDQLCSTPTSGNADFCSAVVSYSAFGDGLTFPAKDQRAQEYYNDFVGYFSSFISCSTSSLSDDCLNYLKLYSCQYAFPQCSSGYAVLPQYDTCTKIIETCGRPFAGQYQYLDCNHNFYEGGIVWVGPGDDDTPTQVSGSTPSTGPNLYLLFIILGVVVIIIIIIAIVLILRGDSSSGGYLANGPSTTAQ